MSLPRARGLELAVARVVVVVVRVVAVVSTRMRLRMVAAVRARVLRIRAQGLEGLLQEVRRGVGAAEQRAGLCDDGGEAGRRGGSGGRRGTRRVEGEGDDVRVEGGSSTFVALASRPVAVCCCDRGAIFGESSLSRCLHRLAGRKVEKKEDKGEKGGLSLFRFCSCSIASKL